MAMAEVEASFWRTIQEIANTLSIPRSTALIVLLRYNWDASSIVADYNTMRTLRLILDRCPEAVPVNNSVQRCACCNISVLCEHFYCGHFVCGTCILASVADQLTRSRFLMCPGPECGQFMNYENLPLDLMTRYIDSSLHDYIEKTVGQQWLNFSISLEARRRKLLVLQELLCWVLISTESNVGWRSTRLRPAF